MRRQYGLSGGLYWLLDQQCVFHLAIDDGLDTLQVRQETALHHLGDVHADTALFLGFTAAAYAASRDGAGAG